MLSREEGLIFVDPNLMVASDRQMRMKLRKNLPLASLSTLRKISTMYPRPDLSRGEYGNQFDRTNALISGLSFWRAMLIIEWIFDCNTRWIANAFGNKTYNYKYSIQPSVHGAELFITFLNIKLNWRGKRRIIRLPHAQAWQSYLISFIKHGDPNVERRPGTIPWRTTGAGINVLKMEWDGFSWTEDDQVPSDRCGFWQRAEYAPPWNITSFN
jgi:carboxylesterase type B